MSKRILIVEDEESIADLEKDYLELSGFEVEVANDGEIGLKKGLEGEFDLIILDLMLPGVDGFEICRQIRSQKNTPIIMVSAKKDDIDKIRGLGLGADDYMTKPFNILELKARVKAILRRLNHSGNNAGGSSGKKRVTSGDIELDYNLRRVSIKGKIIDLTAKEFDLLDLFVNNPGRVYSRESLLDIVWGYDYPGDIRTVDVHVRRLREKIEPLPAEPIYIYTKWGVGYYYKEA